ncbi:efflux transporter outer membrane subunit [Desulfococcaceae bacterium OttesenSCG-928-F15]|nr:efflux transporter outer membrane subunit [Desulfococcaceae bacterium OttesenSCG-928-F15]
MSFFSKSILRSGLVLLLCLTLSGCLGSKRAYQRPELEMSGSWMEEGLSDKSLAGRWWEDFKDPVLNRLVEEALEKNIDLAASGLLVMQARIKADLAGGDRLPTVKAGGGTEISRDFSTDSSSEKHDFSVSGSVSYEVDLWGRLSSLHEAARWEAMATEEDRASTAIALVATTINLYWEIAWLNQRIETEEASIAHAKKTLELVKVQKDAGTVTSLELLEAERNLANQESGLFTLVQQRVEKRNALSILFGGPPKTLEFEEPQRLSLAHLPEVAAGLPAELLSRRPDLKSAEARLRGTLASGNATRASYYPSFTLSGTLGSSSDSLSDVLKNPIGSLAANILLPFVQWREMHRNIRLSEVEYDHAVLTFRQTLYNALADVENSLSARTQYRLQEEKLIKNLDAAKKSEALYALRYEAGAIPIINWLDAQENRRQAEISLAENRLNQLQNQVTLYKALGGDMDFDVSNPE